MAESIEEWIKLVGHDGADKRGEREASLRFDRFLVKSRTDPPTYAPFSDSKVFTLTTVSTEITLTAVSSEITLTTVGSEFRVQSTVFRVQSSETQLRR